MAQAPVVQLRLFGGVAVDGPRGPVTLRRRQERALMGVLLLEHGRAVSADRLVALLWDEPPARARRAVQSHVARIRAALQSAGVADGGVQDGGVHDGGVQLAGNQNGYTLRVPPDSVDVHRFRDLAGRAKASPQPQARLELLDAALDLWVGPVFGDDIDDRLRHRLCADLEESRLVAEEDRGGTLLELGRFADAQAWLSRLVVEHPTRERLAALYLAALYQGGRKAEALTAYERIRAFLADQLGVDPGGPLRRLHQAILRDEPVPAGPGAATGHWPASERTGDRRPDVPAQLTADIASFTGRADDVDRLQRLLTAADRAPVAVSGPGGIGKSALSIHVAHRIADQFPDGQLYLDLLGASPDAKPLEPLEALSQLLRSLTGEASATPTDVAAAATRYRSLTSGRRLLILLDNAADAAQVRPLLPGSATCAVLVTSRRMLRSLDALTRHELGVMPQSDAATLLRGIVGDARVDAEPEAVADVTRLCGGLPLALAIAAARLASRPSWPVRTLVERLASEQQRLRELAVDDQAVRTSFQASYRDAGADPQGGATTRMFRLLGLLDSTEIGLPAAAALAGVGTDSAEPLLETLVDLRLVEPRGPGRYRMHDLLHLFARELATGQETAAERRQAVHRTLEHYLATALSVVHPLDMWRLDLVGYRPTATGETLTSPAAVAAWVEREYANLLAAARQAAASDGAGPHLAVGIAVAAQVPLESRGRWREQLGLGKVALAAAERTGDPRHHGLVHANFGWAHFSFGDVQESLSHFARALASFRSARCRVGEAIALHGQGATHRLQGLFAASLDHLEQARLIYHELRMPGKEAACLTGIGLTEQRLGRYPEAIDAHRRSVAAIREAGGNHGEIMMLGNLAEAHRLAGDPATAITVFEEALARGAATGNVATYWEAEHRWGLGRALSDSGDPTRARQSWHRSVAILYDLGLITADQRDAIDASPAPETPEVIARQL